MNYLLKSNMDSTAQEQLPQSHSIISSSEVLGCKKKNRDQDKLGQVIATKYHLLQRGGALGLQKSPSAKELTGSLAGTFVSISRGFSDTPSQSCREQGVTIAWCCKILTQEQVVDSG